MEIEVDLDDAFDAFCNRGGRGQPKRLSVKDLADRVYQLLDTAPNWEDMADALEIVIDKSEELKAKIEERLNAAKGKEATT